VLDTNTVSALMKGHPPVAERIAGVAREDVGISQVTAAEIEFGLKHLPSSKRRSLLQDQWNVVSEELLRLPWNDEVSRVFGERKAQLERRGNRMSDFDLAIAAHAIAFDLTLVTSDTAFARLRIRCEDWIAG
jgi:tRNA(fMet)-specific endonuclease VapC